jgi:hypothetical protein
MRTYNQQQTEPIKVEQPPYTEKQFLHTLNAGVGLPLAQAVVTSGAFMLTAATLIYAFDGMDYIKPMIITGVLTFVFVWIGLQRRWLTLTNLERLTGLDLDNNKVIGEPPKVRVQVDEVTPQGTIHVTKLFDLPATPTQLHALATGLLEEGMGLSEKEWTPLAEGKPFSLKQFRDLKAEMIKRGMVVQVNSKSVNLGHTMTVMGKKVLERYRLPNYDGPNEEKQ